MSTFDDREKAEEAKYARKEELEFKIKARRNKLLGLWAAGKMGITGDRAEAYAKEIVSTDLHEKGDEDVYRRVAGDFKKKSVEMSEHRIRREMTDLLEVARKELTTA